MPSKRTAGDEAIAWIERYCRIPQGARVGQAVRLAEFQKQILHGIYDSPTRRAIISFGRKNAKTTLSAFLLLLHLCGPKARLNSQLFSAAQSRDQAALLFDFAAKVVRMSPDLLEAVSIRDSTKQLHCGELGTTYRALSADASTALGLSPAFCVHDELGQVRGPRSDLYSALETASAGQEQPLSIVISTQAANDGDLLSMLIDDAKTGSDPRLKLFLYSAPDSLDPFSEDAIRAANPAFEAFQNQAEVLQMAADAKRMPSSESAYRNLVLNQRVATASPFISESVWRACSGRVDEDVFATRPVFVGLDLSARNDLTALSMIARGIDGVFHVKAEFFAPALGVAERARRDAAPYDLWIQQGFIRVTPGASVDYETIARRLCEIADDFDLQVIGYDRWRIDVLKAELARLGRELPLKEVGQGFKDMAPAIDALEAELLNGNLRHGGNPVLEMCARHAIVVRDGAGNRKLDKSKATSRIDGIVALAMALGVAQAEVKVQAPEYTVFFVG